MATAAGTKLLEDLERMRQVHWDRGGGAKGYAMGMSEGIFDAHTVVAGQLREIERQAATDLATELLRVLVARVIEVTAWIEVDSVTGAQTPATRFVDRDRMLEILAFEANRRGLALVVPAGEG